MHKEKFTRELLVAQSQQQQGFVQEWMLAIAIIQPLSLGLTSSKA